MSTDNKSGLSRRDFFSRAGAMAGGSAMLAAAALSTGDAQADIFEGEPSQGDYDILRFLAAAELIEDDLWQQYCELAADNPEYNAMLRTIDRSLPRYVCDDRDNERSHHRLINSYLQLNGQAPVNLDPFRTLPSSQAQGAQQIGRLTNLRNLTVDTSWFFRYRSTENPDFGAEFPQIANIVNQPTIPVLANESHGDIQTMAMAAAFHFATIEQGGASLYASLMQKVTSLNVILILASIGPVEFYQFAAFHKSLESLDGGGNPNYPNLRDNEALAQAILPEPCMPLPSGLELVSILRPTSTMVAGAGATATGLVESGLFEGQSNDFLNAVVGLATAADAAQRQCAR